MAVTEAFEFIVEGLGADAEDFGGAGLVAGGELNRARDHLLLDVLERTAQRDLDEAAVAAAAGAEVVGQVGLPDGMALAHYKRSLDNVAQLAHVARPRMRRQRLHAFLVDPGHS